MVKFRAGGRSPSAVLSAVLCHTAGAVAAPCLNGAQPRVPVHANTQKSTETIETCFL